MATVRPSQGRMVAALSVGALGFVLPGCGSTTGQAVTDGALDGTIWCSPNEHARVAVDRFGAVEVKEGKDVCAVFAAESDLYVMKIVWWNVSNAIHVEEWGVAIPVSDTKLHYEEAQHEEGSSFPGVIGTGEFSLVSDTEMTLVQLGRLADGSAAGFTTSLAKVDQLPDIPVPITYPTD